MTGDYRYSHLCGWFVIVGADKYQYYEWSWPEINKSGLCCNARHRPVWPVFWKTFREHCTYRNVEQFCSLWQCCYKVAFQWLVPQVIFIMYALQWTKLCSVLLLCIWTWIYPYITVVPCSCSLLTSQNHELTFYTSHCCCHNHIFCTNASFFLNFWISK